MLAVDICECFYSCGDDPATGCSQSGDWHQHTDYPCDMHPDAPIS